MAHILLFFENKNDSFGGVGHDLNKKEKVVFEDLNLGGILHPKDLSFFLSLYLIHDASAAPSAPRPPRPAGSPSSSASSSQSDGVPRERERSPRTLLPTPVPTHVPVLAPMHPPPRTPMMDTCRYRNLFPRRRVAPPTPPPSDDQPSDDRDGDDREDSQTADTL
ncbi:hypothetical protein PIB30_038561 [Stylosanthes scabra]|uniref:Uncharacterized protein n=1 Tax=Stylosanthes scabra TaxID=79078 RepID=A0ABU6YES6_9FABA|nr:hypothetical protein [Stylosanthes scabra]